MFIIFISSCKTKNIVVEKKIIKCTNKTYNKNLSNGFGVSFRDYYKHILIIENIFISEGILKSKSKANYLLLSKSINKFITKEKASEIINAINLKFNQNNLPKFNNIISNSGSINCIYKILKNEKYEANKFLQNIAYSYGEFEKYGYNNQKSLARMFKNISSDEFNNIVYRSYCDLVIYLIILDKSEED